MKTYVRIIMAMIHRDMKVHYKHFLGRLIDFGLIVPILSSISFGYIQPLIVDPCPNPLISTELIIGSLLISLLEIGYLSLFPFLIDLCSTRQIFFHLTILPPPLILLQKIISASLAMFMVILPFYPACKIILGSLFTTHTTSWFWVITLLYVSTLMVSAYCTYAMTLLPTTYSGEKLWMRFNIPLMLLGGIAVPWRVMYATNPWCGYLGLLNPFLYVAEGLRGAFVSHSTLLTPLISCTSLFGFTLIFYYGACHKLQQRLDHL